MCALNIFRTCLVHQMVTFFPLKESDTSLVIVHGALPVKKKKTYLQTHGRNLIQTENHTQTT